MSWGNLNPGFFFYPGFFVYQVFVLGSIVGALGGEYHHLLLSARVLTATYGVATVGFVYLLGARLGGRLTGTLSAGMVAFTGALTLQAHYAVTDTPATALATATLWLSVRAWQHRSYGQITAAAVLAGLAVSTKYSMAPVVAAPWVAFMAVAFRRRESMVRQAAGSVALAGIAIAAFLVTSPFTVLDQEGFWRDIRAESRLQAEGRGGEHVAALQDPGVTDRGLVGNARVMYEDLGAAALVLAVGTLLAALVRGARAWRAVPPEADGDAHRRASVDWIGALMVAVWVLGYFALMAPSAKFGQRYAIPIYPAMMLLAAVPLALALTPRNGDRSAWRRLGAAALLLAVALPAAVDAVRSTSLLARRDTRLVARDWVIANVPPGTRLAREFYAPPFHQADGFRLMQPFALTDHSFETYCDDDVSYLILSSLNADRYASDAVRFADERAWYRLLEERTRLVHRVDGMGDLPGHHPTIEVRLLHCGRGR